MVLMKKVLCILALVFAMSLTACGSGSTGSTTSVSSTGGDDPRTTATQTDAPSQPEEAILSLVESFDATEVDGFDFSSKQTLNDTIVNQHTVSVRLDKTNGTVASRVERRKRLNEDFSGEQFTETETASYYQNGRIATQKDGGWIWANGSLNDFISVKTDGLKFDLSALHDVTPTTNDNETVLTFRIADKDAASFLGVSQPIKDLSFEIKADVAGQKLISFTMRYSQELTSTEFRLIPYSGNANITLPD